MIAKQTAIFSRSSGNFLLHTPDLRSVPSNAIASRRFRRTPTCGYVMTKPPDGSTVLASVEGAQGVGRVAEVQKEDLGPGSGAGSMAGKETNVEGGCCGEGQEAVQVLQTQKEGLGMAAKSQSGSTTSKGMSWVTAAQEKKILRKYDLAITESEGQQTVEIPDEVINNANPLWEDYLIGKFLDTAPHIARIHAVVNKIWSYGDKKQVIDVQEVDVTTMTFRITNANVRARVLRRGMWNIGNIPLVVTKWTPYELKEKP